MVALLLCVPPQGASTSRYHYYAYHDAWLVNDDPHFCSRNTTTEEDDYCCSTSSSSPTISATTSSISMVQPYCCSLPSFTTFWTSIDIAKERQEEIYSVQKVDASIRNEECCTSIEHHQSSWMVRCPQACWGVQVVILDDLDSDNRCISDCDDDEDEHDDDDNDEDEHDDDDNDEDDVVRTTLPNKLAMSTGTASRIEAATTMTLSPTTNIKRKCVQWADCIQIRQYAVTVGDHPSCSDGLPLTLDWYYYTNADDTIMEQHQKSSYGAAPAMISPPERLGPYRLPSRLSYLQRRARLLAASVHRSYPALHTDTIERGFQ